jgi:integrase
MLTTTEIDSFKPGPGRREIADGKQAGLYFVIQPSGARSWAYRYRSGGKTRKLTLGAYPAIGLKDARARAAAASVQVTDGGDPAAEKAAKRAALAAETTNANDLVETVAGRFIAQYVRRNLKASTISEVERILNKEILPAWRGRRLSQIGRADIHNLLDDIVEREAPITANRTLSWFRRMCSWAVERELIDTNPCLRVKAPAAETSRDRVLSDVELKAVWLAAGTLEQPYEAFVKLLILTGQRRNEVAGMRRSEIDLAAKLWTLPKERAKNGREHTLPLSDQAIEILHGLPRISGSEFALTLFGSRPITGFNLVKQRIDARVPDAAPWVFHDVRRTVASGLARLGVNLPVIEKLLNHVSGSFGGIVGVYQRHSFSDEKRAAMQAWANFVDTLVTGQADNVVQMAARDGR